MQVILLQDVARVGHRFEVVDVSGGYANNFLFPKKLAEPATPGKVATLEKKRVAAQVAEDARKAQLKEKLEELKDTAIVIEVKADEQGHLFKKIRQSDIEKVLRDDHDLDLPEGSILLDAPLHEVGDHEVPVDAAGEKVTLTIQIVKES